MIQTTAEITVPKGKNGSYSLVVPFYELFTRT